MLFQPWNWYLENYSIVQSQTSNIKQSHKNDNLQQSQFFNLEKNVSKHINQLMLQLRILRILHGDLCKSYDNASFWLSAYLIIPETRRVH